MKIAKENWLDIICFALILLWSYAAISKTLNFAIFKLQLHRQVLPLLLKNILAYLLPVIETGLVCLLTFRRTLLSGLWMSLVLLLLFSIYVGLALTGALGRIPCSCGGLLSAMSWDVHLVFNLFFLLLTALGIHIVYRERRLKI